MTIIFADASLSHSHNELQVTITAQSRYELVNMVESNDEATTVPLMHESEDGVPDHSPTTKKSATSPSVFVWALTFSAGISGLLFGYESDLLFKLSCKC